MAALTLLEAAKLHSGDAVRSAVIEMFAESSPILRALPFVTIEGNALRYNREQTLPGVAFRGINESWTPSTGVLNPATEPLVIGGGELDVDTFITETMGEDQREVHEMMKVKALSLKIADTIINGDSLSEPREFDGLKARLVNNQLIDAGATSGGDALSLAKLDETIDNVHMPNAIIMNRKMRRLLTAAARNASVGGYITYEKDEFGVPVTYYSDLPILISDEDESGNAILPWTEVGPGGGSAVCTSIYVVSFRESMLQGIQNGVMRVKDLGELETTPAQRTRVEWFVGLAMLHGRAAARLQGIKDAAVTA